MSSICYVNACRNGKEKTYVCKSLLKGKVNILICKIFKYEKRITVLTIAVNRRQQHFVHLCIYVSTYTILCFLHITVLKIQSIHCKLEFLDILQVFFVKLQKTVVIYYFLHGNMPPLYDFNNYATLVFSKLASKITFDFAHVKAGKMQISMN